MSSLEINSHGRAYDLSPVSRLSRLTDLILVNSRSHNEGSLEIDLRSLPASLRVLVIRGRGLRTTGLQHLMFVNLTHLTCDFDTIRDAFDLLQDLPLLRDLTVEFLGEPRSRPDMSEVFRLTRLTSLTLEWGSLTTPSVMPAQDAAYKKLTIWSSIISRAWLQSIYSLACVTELSMSLCTEDRLFDRSPLTLTSPLRSLELTFCPLSFLPSCGTGSEGLQSMQYYEAIEAGEPQIRAIASFSSLTQLRLQGFSPSAGFQWLRHLSLEQLNLYDCSNAETKLFQPGCLTALRELHIQEDPDKLKPFREKLKLHDPQAEQEAEQLTQAWKALLSIPNLRHISGSCKLFIVSGFKGLEEWRMDSSEPGYHCPNHSSNVRDCIDCSDAYQVWTKP